MKVITKLDLGHNFNKNLQVKIDDLVASHVAKQVSTCPQANIDQRNQNIITEVRRIANQAYSLGVEQGIIQRRDTSE